MVDLLIFFDRVTLNPLKCLSLWNVMFWVTSRAQLRARGLGSGIQSIELRVSGEVVQTWVQVLKPYRFRGRLRNQGQTLVNQKVKSTWLLLERYQALHTFNSVVLLTVILYQIHCRAGLCQIKRPLTGCVHFTGFTGTAIYDICYTQQTV